MEKRFVLFFILSFVIIMLYPYVLEKLGVAPVPVPAPSLEKVVQEDKESLMTEGQEVVTQLTEAAVEEMIPGFPPAQEQRIIVETDLYRAVFSTKGGTIVDWRLKRYLDKTDMEPVPIGLYNEQENGLPPLTIQTGIPSTDELLRNGIYHLEGDDLKLSADRPKGTLSMVWDDRENERRITKTLTFSNDSYQVKLALNVQGPDEKFQIYLGTNFGIVDWGGKRVIGFIGPVVMSGGEIEKYKPGKIGAMQRHSGVPQWVALQDKYFIAAMIPQQASTAIATEVDERSVTIGLEYPMGTPTEILLYAGPKEFDRLSETSAGLEKTIDFGWFMFGSLWLVWAIAEPLFHFLQFLYQYVNNYGACIILLTVVVRSLFIPLMHKSHKSMKAMQAIQPAMAALQKKHKKDKERLNREMMDLYKKHGANPLGGCLPMLLQLPVFIALFNVLNSTIELRQAPFLWIADLSSKDPFYVLPIVMGASMMIQQKMQPMTMDPKQAKLFMFLPVFFTILFLNFPGGLVLYWLTNNLLTILQQYITIKYIDKKKTVSP